MSPQSTSAPIASARTLVASLMAALVVIGLVLSFVVTSGARRPGETMPVWPYGAVLAVGALAALLILVAGYRVSPVPPGLDAAEARKSGVAAFMQSTMIRLALSESVAFVSIVLMFSARPRSVQIYYLGGAATLVLMAYHVWPGQRVIERVQQNLDRDGGRSDLASVLAGQAY
ncbi:MAG: hypothetical protein ABI301_06010 [Jatrophihabitantaceae bacterium]